MPDLNACALLQFPLAVRSVLPVGVIWGPAEAQPWPQVASEWMLLLVREPKKFC